MAGLRCCAVVAVAAVALVTGAYDAGAQAGGWERVLTLPSRDVGRVTFAGPQTAWAAGSGGIFRSNDAGATWSTAYISDQPLADVAAAPDGVNGWAVGVLATVLRTRDGGVSWEPVPVPTELNLLAVAALDADSAIVGGEGFGITDVIIEPQASVILRTDDGGATWQQISVDGLRPRVIEFLANGRDGWMSGLRCGATEGLSCTLEQLLYATNDGGSSWRRLDANVQYLRLDFVSQDDGWAITYGCDSSSVACASTVRMTRDGGRTWTDVRSTEPSSSSSFSSLFAFSVDSAVVMETRCENSCRTTLLRTDDAGATWDELGALPGDSYASSVTFGDQAKGVAVGRSVWMTTDAGASWQQSNGFPVGAGSGDVDFADASAGWYGGSRLLRTTDGGTTFAPIGALDPPSDFDFVSPTEGWGTDFKCDGDNPCTARVLHTVDAGETWTVQYSRELGNNLSVGFVDARNGWAYSFYDRLILHTTDGGATWIEQQAPIDGRNNQPSISFVSGTSVWLAEPVCDPGFESCRILAQLSSDGGRTYNAAGAIPHAGGCQVAVEAVSAREAWIMTDECTAQSGAVLYRTVDGGATWARSTLPGMGVPEFKFFDARTGRAIVTSCDQRGENCFALLLRTRDGGRSWTEERLENPGAFAQRHAFVTPELIFRSIQAGGGVFAVSRQELLRYRGAQTPITLPDTGSASGGGGASGLAAAVAVLAAACATLAAAAIRIRSVRA